jgi:hypothetical protein
MDRFVFRVALVMTFLILWMGLGGCAALVPAYVGPEIEHMSHITQHAIVGTHNDYSECGINIAQITAHWDVSKRVYADVSDGVSITKSYGPYSYGEIMGPREQFTAKIGYKLWQK